MTKEEALRLALEAMKINNKAWKLLADSGDAGNWEAEEQGYYQLNEQAINAIKEALETKDRPVQVSPFEFVEIVYEKECLIGRPIVWAQWPNEEKNT